MNLGRFWRRRGRVTKQHQPGDEPRRNSINVPIDTYVALCGMAYEYGTSISGVVDLITRDLPQPKQQQRAYARPDGP